MGKQQTDRGTGAKESEGKPLEPQSDKGHSDLVRPTDPLVEAYQVAPGSNLPPGYRMTEAGAKWLRQLAQMDLSQKSIAAMFRMSPSWLAKQIRENDVARAAFEEGQAERELEYRQARMVLEKINPAVHIHVGKTKYGEVPVETTEVKHTIHVVGASPDADKLTIEDWQRQFAPRDTIEATAKDITPAPSGAALKPEQSDERDNDV